MVFNKTTNVTIRPYYDYPITSYSYNDMQTQMENCHLSEALYHERGRNYAQAQHSKRVLRAAKARVAKEARAEGFEEGKKAGIQEAADLQQLQQQSIELGRQIERNGGVAPVTSAAEPLMIDAPKPASQVSRRSGVPSAGALPPTSNVQRYLEAQSGQVSRMGRPSRQFSRSATHTQRPQSNVSRFLAAQGRPHPQSSSHTGHHRAHPHQPQSSTTQFLAPQTQISSSSQRTIRAPPPTHHYPYGAFPHRSPRQG
ncbi:MAG: hypothetical protein Q9191_005452, partial [Dirinaria sp. TL-2023a]